MNEWASCWCFGTPVGASALLLVLRNSCCMGSHVLIDALALLLVFRHSCWCFGTPVGATTLLLCGQPRPDRCFGTPVGATALLLRVQARSGRYYSTSVLYCTFGYLLCCVLLISYDWSGSQTII